MNVPIEFCAWLIGDNDTEYVKELYKNWERNNPEVTENNDNKQETI
jgi:hypothetical protein